MSDLHHDQPHNPLQKLNQQHDESDAMLAILIAGIAALFIAGIVSAFIYAKDTNLVTAQAPSAPVAAAPPTNPTPNTTGQAISGSDNRNPPALPRNRDVNQTGDPL